MEQLMAKLEAQTQRQVAFEQEMIDQSRQQQDRLNRMQSYLEQQAAAAPGLAMATSPTPTASPRIAVASWPDGSHMVRTHIGSRHFCLLSTKKVLQTLAGFLLFIPPNFVYV